MIQGFIVRNPITKVTFAWFSDIGDANTYCHTNAYSFKWIQQATIEFLS